MTDPRFATRGVVLTLRDIRTVDWPALANRAGLTTIATHIFPHEVAAFVRTQEGRAFLERCRSLGLAVEHELHALCDLLPRALFERDAGMFRMDESGSRVPDFNLCVSSEAALEVVCRNAAEYTRLLPSTTGRYFYWIDDGMPMCRCPRCRSLSDSDQALLVENAVLRALRRVEPRASLAHLVYLNTLSPPTQIEPADGIFMEYAPIRRRYDRPLRDSGARMGAHPSHGELLDTLDANLAVFGADTAQALEYWLDLSRFSDWKRENVMPLPWRRDVFLEDLETYAARGIRHITSFAAWLDGEYVERFGEPPVGEYGEGFGRDGADAAQDFRPARTSGSCPGYPAPR
jgi:hypothetical protein